MSHDVSTLTALPPELLTCVLCSLAESMGDVKAAICAHRTFVAAANQEALWEVVALRWTWRLRKLATESFRGYCFRCSRAAQRQCLLFLGGSEELDKGHLLHSDVFALAASGSERPSQWLAPPAHLASGSVVIAPAAATSGSTLFVAGGLHAVKEEDPEPLSEVVAMWPERVIALCELPRAACFGAADVDAHGRLWLTGGGDSIYRGAHVFDDVCMLDLSEGVSPQPQWAAAGKLQRARCGHALAADARTTALWQVGGYGGGQRYEDTIESFDTVTGHSTMAAARMAFARSGAGAACGPDGGLYVVGGSTNGSRMLTSCERYDPRVGAWDALPPLPKARGYLAAAFGCDGVLYAAGGSGVDGFGTGCTDFIALDPRRGAWKPMAPLPVGRANLAMALVDWSSTEAAVVEAYDMS